MQYPGRIIKVGEQDKTLVATLKQELNDALGIGADPALRLNPDNRRFDLAMKRAVKLFQARHVDDEGRPLKQDGEIGPLTWAALFGSATVPGSETTDDALLGQVLRIAGNEEAKHVREVPVNSNRGPEVDAYLRRAGVSPGLSWCCAFVYWCFDEAALRLGRSNPMVKTAGCLDHWRRAPEHGARRVTKSNVAGDPGEITPGMIFIVDHGGGLGHTGLIEKVAGGLLTTIEGNTDASLTREGGGVYRLTRKIADINKGFIDYAGL
jgi:hypothetical protein